jgi:hypothetical protein
VLSGPHPGKRCEWNCGLGTCDAPPIFPPWWFVRQWNQRGLAGSPYATALDPLVLYSWHLVCRPEPQPPMLLTGI